MKELSIETPRTLLRPFTSNDVETFFNITRCPSIKQYISGAYTENIKDATELLNNYYLKADFKKDFYWLIVEKVSQEVIGAFMMNETFFRNDYSVAYFIAPNYRRNGFMKEIVTSFITTFPLPQKPILFYVEKSNFPSLNLIRSIEGMEESNPSEDTIVFAFKKHLN